MKTLLVFIDGTICDTRHRHHWIGMSDFYQVENLLADRAVQGSLESLAELASRYEIVYVGARPESTRPATEKWLGQMGFPKGEVYLGESHPVRLALVREMRDDHDFIAGIGDRWDDNELHAELGCASIILKEFDGDWAKVSARIDRLHRAQKIEANKAHLRGKVEGLARVCPLLLTKYGPEMWETYIHAVLEMAESSREKRREEDLVSFREYGLNPGDLRDAARWDAFLREADWEDNPTYGLQEVQLVEATSERYVHKVTKCYYAELWQEHGHAEIGYQIHCRTDMVWWDKPAWNPDVRFEQPKTLMQGNEFCLFIQTLENSRPGQP